MNHQLPTPEWQQNYPTYKLGHTDVALAEYEAAATRTRDDERAISIANGALLAAAAPTLPVISPYLVNFLTNSNSLQDRSLNVLLFLIAIAFLTGVVAAYFCGLRRSYVFSARKVIVLRRMLVRAMAQLQWSSLIGGLRGPTIRFR
jgi:hypothetical protein